MQYSTEVLEQVRDFSYLLYIIFDPVVAVQEEPITQPTMLLADR